MNETKYRKQALAIWDANQEETVLELKADIQKRMAHFTQIKKMLGNLVSHIFKHPNWSK